MTLVPHDWGGPIALPWAARRCEAVRGLLLLNTFVPRLPGPMGQRGSLRLLRSRLTGPMLVTRRNVPTEHFLFKAGTAHPERWTETTKRAYRAPHADPRSRTPMLVFARDPVHRGSPGGPVDELGDRATQDPAGGQAGDDRLGMKDVLFGAEVLARWEEVFPHARGGRLPDAGHFVPEDAPQQVLSI